MSKEEWSEADPEVRRLLHLVPLLAILTGLP